MNDNIENLLYKAGLTAQGCWEELDQYAQEAIIRVIEITVEECLDIVEDEDDGSADTKSVRWAMIRIKKHFGVQE